MDSAETRELVTAILEEGARTGALASVIREHLGQSVMFHLPNGEVGDAALFEVFMEETAGSLPDVTVTLDHVLIDGDRALLQFTQEGTHTRRFRGFEPTGQRFTIPVCWIVRFEGRRIVELWYYASIYEALVPAYLERQSQTFEAGG